MPWSSWFWPNWLAIGNQDQWWPSSKRFKQLWFNREIKLNKCRSINYATQKQLRESLSERNITINKHEQVAEHLVLIHGSNVKTKRNWNVKILLSTDVLVVTGFLFFGFLALWLSRSNLIFAAVVGSLENSAFLKLIRLYRLRCLE